MEEKQTKRFFRPADIVEELDCSVTYAYGIIRTLNAELQKQGYLTAAGRVPAAYFLERYGVKEKPLRVSR